ncbi:hypothetical protein XA26_24890 [Mycolicibacterium fortuitum]|uniref:Uncharacterized protein n=1 Tax=Mycolicibacterium fortuitum TaxID=1766 RepID=A0A0N9YFJ9_MYCFO|nr:hypothetical protein XA26_24890 [Mycolicibacterium fortuitum]
MVVAAQVSPEPEQRGHQYMLPTNTPDYTRKVADAVLERHGIHGHRRRVDGGAVAR